MLSSGRGDGLRADRPVGERLGGLHRPAVLVRNGHSPKPAQAPAAGLAPSTPHANAIARRERLAKTAPMVNRCVSNYFGLGMAFNEVMLFHFMELPALVGS
jgi:hypothetical protein